MRQAMMINTMNEIEKLTAKPGVKLYFWLAALGPVLMVFLAEKIQTNDMITLPSLNISFSILHLFIMLVLPLFSFMAAADLFAGEWDKGSLFHARPVNNLELFLSKNTAIGILCFTQLVIIWLSGTISIAVAEKEMIWSEVGSTLLSMFISIIPLVAIICFASFLSQCFKHSATALSFMIFGYVIMAGLPFIFPQTTNLFPTAYLDWHLQWHGNVNILWISMSFIYLFSYSSLFFISGYYIFKTKEL